MDGIFLHTSWRSSGTWIWQQLRNEPGRMGFYEPLHEALPSIRLPELRQLTPQSWRSGHGVAATPYFAEYEALLKPDQRKGVQLAHYRFAFDNFFASAGERHDDLHAYISLLVALARDAGKTPVLKFTRSQGRLPWFAAQFPQGRHVALIRQPWTQFRSAWRCFAADGNKYFLATAFLVLERNLANPGVAALARALSLPLVWSRALPLRTHVTAWKIAARLLDDATLYKAHFALWLLNTLQACGAANTVVDGDAPPAMLAKAFNLNAQTAARPAFQPPPRWPALTPDMLQTIHNTALRALAPRISQALAPRLQNWLHEAETVAARDLGGAGRMKLAEDTAS